MEDMYHRQVVVWLLIGVLAILGVTGCSEDAVTANSAVLPAPVVPTFTYTTYGGAIWQVDVNGRKRELFPADGIHKLDLRWSPGRQWLSYLAVDLTQIGTTIDGLPNGGQQIVPIYRSERTLRVIEADGTPLNLPVRGAASAAYRWEDSHTVRLWLSDNPRATLIDPRDSFRVDVKTGGVTALQPEQWHPPTPAPGPSYSPDRKWALQVEREGEFISAYLFDASGNKIATILDKAFNPYDGLSQSPDSRYLLYHNYPTQEYGRYDIYVYDVTVETSIQLTAYTAQEDFFEIMSPRWSPTGEWVLFWLTTQEFYAHPCLVHVTSNDLHCYEISSKAGGYVWSLDGRYLATIAPAGSDPVDIYMIDAVQNQLVNLTQDGNEAKEVDLVEYTAPSP
jgi:hypothetical protein